MRSIFSHSLLDHDVISPLEITTTTKLFVVRLIRAVQTHIQAKELEFISALHQTGTNVRPNGSIKDEDIKLYLRSRFGIEVTLEQVRSTILNGFGGGGGEESDSDSEEVIDMMELTTIILIPLLLKAAVVEGDGIPLPEGILPPPERLLEDVVAMIVHDSGASAFDTSKDGIPMVDAHLVKNILLLYGENEMANDESLIQEMVDACLDRRVEEETDDEVGNAGGHVAFVPKSFGRALTRDVTLYDLTNERKQSSLIQDVFGNTRNTPHPRRTVASKASMMEPSDKTTHVEEMDHQHARTSGVGKKVSEITNKGQEITEIRRIYTAPAIDIQAGTYRSKTLIVSVWGCVLFASILAYLQTSSGLYDFDCGHLYFPDGTFGENFEGMACDTTESILDWLFRYGLFCFLGLLGVGLGSMGNYVGNTRWYLPLIASLCK
jgi:hypothetical protein